MALAMQESVFLIMGEAEAWPGRAGDDMTLGFMNQKMNTMTTRKLSYLLSFLMLLAMGACSDDDNDVPDPDPDLDPASFTITYSGDIEADIEGHAVFSETTDPDTGEDVFAIFLHSEDMEGTTIYFGKQGPQTGTGNFPISEIDMDAAEAAWPDDAFLAWGNMHYEEIPRYYYFSDTGTLNLEQSDDNSVIGAFEFSATGFSTDDLETSLDIQISGSFHAIYGEVPDLDPDPKPDPDFTASVTGDITTEMEGRALFAELTDGDTDETGFFINLSVFGEEMNQIYLGSGGERPDEGDFSITPIEPDEYDGIGDLPTDDFTGFLIVQTDQGLAYLAADGGSMTLTQSSSNLVAGSFAFDATGFAIMNPLNPISVEINGQFEAQGGEFDLPDIDFPDF